MTSENDLLKIAKRARQNAYARYSGFKVGAAILDEGGNVHAGCNVENAAYPLGSCAEAGAISAMIAGGGAKIAKIVVIGGKDQLVECAPCGGCRQRIAEFASPKTEIYLLDENGALKAHSTAELLPHSFSLDCNDQNQ